MEISRYGDVLFTNNITSDYVSLGYSLGFHNLSGKRWAGFWLKNKS